MKTKRLLTVFMLGLGLILAFLSSLSATGGTFAAPPSGDMPEGVVSYAWSRIQAQLRRDACRVHNDASGGCPLAVGTLPISQVAKLVAHDGGAVDLFGAAVAISGDTVVVGAWRDIVGFNHDQGSAYVFERNQGGPNQWDEVTKIVASDGTDDDYFGISVAIAGDIIVIGAYSDDIGEHTSQGSAYIFKRNPGGADPWVQAKKLIASDGGYWGYFGRAVAVAGDTVIVGAHGDGTGGSAYVFQRDQNGPGLWGEVKKLTANDAASGDSFGYAMAMAGDTVVVGAYQDDVGSNLDQGSAYIFERNQDGPDQWGQVTKLTAGDGAALAYFGRAVAIAGDTVVVGAYGDNLEQGAAYVFGRNQGGADQWGQVTQLTADDGMDGDSFGYAAAMAANTIVIGAHHDAIGSNLDQGSAYVFQSEAKIYLPLTVRQFP